MQESLHDRTAHMVRTRALHEILQIVHTFLIRKKKAILSIRISFHLSRQRRQCKADKPKPLTSPTNHSLQMVPSLPTRDMPTFSPRRPFVFGFFHGPQYFRFFLFSRFLAFHRLVHVLVVVIHGCPPRSFYSLNNSLANCVPIRVDWRRLPSLVSHVRGVDEGAQYTFFHVPAGVSSSAPSQKTAPRKSVVNFCFTIFLTLLLGVDLRLSLLRHCPPQ